MANLMPRNFNPLISEETVIKVAELLADEAINCTDLVRIAASLMTEFAYNQVDPENQPLVHQHAQQLADLANQIDGEESEFWV